MADINEIYAQTPEYRNYVQKSGDKEPTVEKFLETMSPQQRVEFERKYGGKDDRAAEVQKKDKPVEELENVAETERLRSMYSDQNEVWLDRIRVKVLQSMNKVDVPGENVFGDGRKSLLRWKGRAFFSGRR